MVWRRGKEVGNFRKIYGLGEEAADRITFLHPRVERLGFVAKSFWEGRSGGG